VPAPRPEGGGRASGRRRRGQATTWRGSRRDPPGRSRDSGTAWRTPRRATRRTTQSPSGHDSTRSGPGTGVGGAGAVAADPAAGSRLPQLMRAGASRVTRRAARHPRGGSVDYVGRLTAHLPEALRPASSSRRTARCSCTPTGGFVQAAELDVAPRAGSPRSRGLWTVTGKSGRDADHHPYRRSERQPRSISASTPAWSRTGWRRNLQELLAVPARAARRRLAAGPPRVPDPRSGPST